jgi:hypothetical protein
MSQILVQGGATGTGNVTILAPNTNTDRTISLPDNTGTVITTASSGQVIPSGALPAGSILQVVSVNDSTQYTFNSGSSNQNTYYNISGLVASITPKFSTSKILILADITAGQANNSYNAFFRTTRNGSVIGVGSYGSYSGTSTTAFRSSDGGEIGTASINYLDSPATTSSVTYQIQICNAGGSSYPSYVNRPANGNTGWEQSGASTITLLEVAA